MYGAALNHARNPGSYGEIWWARSSRLAECKGMRDAYAKYIRANERMKSDCNWPYLGKCAKPWEDKQEKYEKQGKAAWKRCKRQAKLDDAQEQADLDSQYEEEIGDDYAPYTPGPMLSEPIYAPPSQQPIYDQSAGNLTAASPTVGGSNMMLYAGLGIAGLAAVLLLKKK